MKARDVVGRKIVAVRQVRRADPNRDPRVDLEAIVLDNGAEIRFTVAEMEADYAVVGHLIKPRKR